MLQGDLRRGPVNIFYLMRDDIPGSSRRLVMVRGERDLLVLEKDGSTLRPICDAARNCCAQTVLTGAHPNFVRPVGMAIDCAIAEIQLTRGFSPDGKPVADYQMVHAIQDLSNKAALHDDTLSQALTAVETHETPLVREAAPAPLCASWITLARLKFNPDRPEQCPRFESKISHIRITR